MNKLKLLVLKFCLWSANLFSSEIRDHVSGEYLGRGVILAWGGRLMLIGYRGRPLVPVFLPQQRLTYWNQKIGFTSNPHPDFPRLAPASVVRGDDHKGEAGVMNVVLAHQGGDAISLLLDVWKEICPPENLWIAFGGSLEEFEALDYPRKVFIKHAGLRTRDHQREKQSYLGIFQSMAQVVQNESPHYIYLCEFDHLPLVSDLNQRQVVAMLRERADVMGHWLHRVDGTGHPHFLQHLADPSFLAFWERLSVREDKSAVLSMFGSGSFWTREAFLAVAAQTAELPCYLELYLPTLAHHLGFRVRAWNDREHLLSNLPSRSISVNEGKRRGSWTVHPVKN